MRITCVLAGSLDGFVGTQPGEGDDARRAMGFTDESDRRHVESELRGADAVIVGATSLKAIGAAWDVRSAKGPYPLWAILTNHGLPPELPFWGQHEVPRWLVSARPVPVAAPDVRNVTYGDQHPARFLVAELARQGVEHALLFGGSIVNRLFFEEQLVDELSLTLCPVLVARSDAIPLVAPGLTHLAHFELAHVRTEGNFVFLRYRTRK